MQIRDLKVLEGVEKHRYLRVDQAAELYFQTVRNPDQRRKKAAARLLVLHRAKLVQRTRYPGDPYIYYIQGNRYSHKLQHYLAITDVLLQIKDLAPASSKLDYDIEVTQGNIITDLVINYRNEFRQEKKTYYVEVELNSSGDILEKIRKYEELDFDNSVLVIIHKHRRTVEKIQSNKYIIPVRCVDLARIADQWAF